MARMRGVLRCKRPHCHGYILGDDGELRCMLCGRYVNHNGYNDNEGHQSHENMVTMSRRARYPHSNLSDRHRAKISAELQGRPRTKRNDENEGVFTKSMPDEHRAALRNAHLGKPRSEETKRKISEALRARDASPALKAHLDRLHESQRGKPASPALKAHILKLADAKRGKPVSAEAKQKLREANRAWRNAQTSGSSPAHEMAS
jgi:hypothetical protein